MDERVIYQYMDEWIRHACMIAGAHETSGVHDFRKDKFYFDRVNGVYHCSAVAIINGAICYHFDYAWTIDKSEDVEMLQYSQMQKCFNRVDITIGKRLDPLFWDNKKEAEILVKHFNLFLKNEDYNAMDSFGKLSESLVPSYEGAPGVTYHFRLDINKLNKSTNALYMPLGVIIDAFLCNDIFNYYLKLPEYK